ncbi:6-carboxytetrahydropterin synthase [Ammoniphilus sp. YIM 78166]|uniref:6-carboxytetrahydropterin synthase n=1 Tax=Ammoniphilus sp. YIM 78166 TaxID=1644106 RepID=UPI001F0E3BE9|nr:6-carboxytetrahydropterin synthase [Ammoniphilus sp. YIM 78166]
MSMRLMRKVGFSAAHYYRISSWSEEKNRQIFGPCSSPYGHGHDYSLEVTVEGALDVKSGIVVNITDMDRVIKDVIENEFDGRFLNREHPYFETVVPTTENIVKYLWNTLKDKFRPHTLQKIRLYEHAFLFAEKEEGPLVQFTRKYHFSAAHRLHSDQLSDEENQRIFGKCNNPYGHGHNYYLEVSVKGEIDSVTGMVTNMADLDEIVQREVLSKLDHKHLNYEVEEFKHLNPTSEVVAMVVYQMLEPHLPQLHKIGIWETEKNYFEYVAAP